MKTLTKTLTIVLLLTAITIISILLINKPIHVESYTATVKKEVTVSNVLYESIDDFYLDENEIGIEFSNGSYAIANTTSNTYRLQIIELGDWDIEFDNLQDFENCIKTYISIQNTRLY